MQIPVVLAEHLQLLVIAVLVAVFALLIAWRVGFFRMPQHSPVGVPKIGFIDVLGGFLVYLGAQLFSVPILWFSYILISKIRLPIETDLNFDTTGQGWLNVFALIVASICLLLYAKLIDKKVLDQFWTGRKIGLWYRVKDFLIGVMSWLVTYPVVLVAGQIIAIIILIEYKGQHIDQVAVRQLKSAEESPLLFLVTAGLITTLIPAMEELLFRGLLQTWLRAKIGSFYAVISTAFIFALFHFSSSQGMANVELITSLFALGCFLGYLFERQRCLLASIGLHATFNAVSIMMILMSGE